MSRLGWADLGMATLNDMRANAEMIASLNPSVPVIADADTGYGGPIMVTRTVTQYARAGVAALHIEDQASFRRTSGVASLSLSPLPSFGLLINILAGLGSRKAMRPPSGKADCGARGILQPASSGGCGAESAAVGDVVDRSDGCAADLWL